MTSEAATPGCSQMPSGLILTKSLATPRWPDIAGAYPDKISCYAPLARKPVGIIGLILSTIPSSAKASGYIGLILSPIPSPAKASGYIGLILFTIPSSTKASGYIGLILSPIPSLAKASGYNRLDFVSYTLVRKFFRVQIA